jgi:hypothetical protein
MLFLNGDRFSPHELAAQRVTADEEVHRIGDACARRRRDQSIEQHEIRREPPVAGHVAIARRARVVPTPGVAGMQVMSPLPRRLETILGRKGNEVDVAQPVGLAAGERAE